MKSRYGASVLAILLAVTASLAYGSSDLMAGLAARRVAPVAIAWWGHVAGALVLTGVAVAVAGRPTLSSLGWGAVAGGIASVGLVLFYGALARGPVSVVTPLAATGVAVPVVVGALRGEPPGPIGWIGLAVAAVGVLVVALTRSGGPEEPNPPCVGARPGCPDEQGSRSPRVPPVVAALLAAAAFGAAFVLIDQGGTDRSSAFWVAAGLQIGGLLGLLPIVLAGSLTRVRPRRPTAIAMTVPGLLAAGGDVALAVAFVEGSLSTVSVLGSLDSVASVLLAQLVLRERLRPVQAVAVLAALTGAVLLAAG